MMLLLFLILVLFMNNVCYNVSNQIMKVVFYSSVCFILARLAITSIEVVVLIVIM